MNKQQYKRTFKQFLVESTMTVQQAKDILSLDSFPDLKSAFKAAVKKAHPDVGGTNELMVKVNAAYEILKRLNIKGDKSSTEYPSWDEIDKRINDAVKQVNAAIRKNFDAKKFESHLEKIIGQSFKAGKAKYLGDDHTGHGSPSFAGIDVSFTSRDGLTVFKLYASVYLPGVNSGNGLSDSSGGSYSISVEGTGFVSGRSFKVNQSSWKAPRLNSLSVSDPEKVFPKAKILRQLKTASKKKITRKDFVSVITKVIGGVRYDKDVFYIKNKKGVEFLLGRSVFMRKGVWDIEFGEKVGKLGIFRRSKVSMGFIQETSETLDFFLSIKDMTENQIITGALEVGGQKNR